MALSEDGALISPVPGWVGGWRGVFQMVQYHIYFLLLLATTIVFWKIGIGVVKLLWFSERVQAKVTGIAVVQEERGPVHTLSVGYRFDGVEYVDHLRISAQDADSHKVGDVVQVDVLPESPGRAHLHNENYPSVWVTTMLGGIVLMPTLASGKLFWRLYLSRRKGTR